MVKKSNRRRRRKSSRRRRRRRRTRRNQRGGGCLKNEYTATDPTPAGVAFEPGKNNGLGGGYYYKLNHNPSLLGFPKSTVGEMGTQKGGRRRRKRRRRRRRKSRKSRKRRKRKSRRLRRFNQRGGHNMSYSRGSMPSLSGLVNAFLPNDVIDIGRNIGTGAKNYLHKYEGEVPEVSPDVMAQPDLKIIKKPSHIF